MASVRLLMPTHLFPVKHAEARVVVALDPVFFEGPDGTFKIHKGKIAYLVAAATEYAAHFGAEVCYPEAVAALYGSLETAEVVAYPPMDRFVEKKLKKLKKLLIEPHPGFVLSPTEYSGAEKLVSVYKAAREKTGILKSAKSLDESNREPPDDGLSSKADPPKKAPMSKAARAAVAYAERAYPDHFGNARACCYYPATRKAALARLRVYAARGIFLMKYQDAIVRGRDFLGHSVLSAAINVGLLSPAEVCEAVAKSGAAESDVEGFVRQILGWRELMAIVYARRTPKLDKAFSTFPRPGKAWYEGATGILPLDDVVTRASRTAYLHHIERLMVALNAMVLSGHRAGAAYRWFTEVVSIDAYDWVMVGNLSAMGYAKETGSTVARKPYISGSGYVAKMSGNGYGDEGGWKDKWDAMFYDYVRRENIPYFRRILEGKRYKERSAEWAQIRSSLSIS